MDSAEAVAADVGRSRSVTIEISNATKNCWLVNPRYVPGTVEGGSMMAALLPQPCLCFSAGQGVPGKRGNVRPASAHAAPSDDRGLHFHKVQRPSNRQHWRPDIRAFGEAFDDVARDAGHHVLRSL